MRAQAWISSKQETEVEEQKQNLQNTEREDSLLGGGRDSVKITELYRDYFKKCFFLFFNSKHLIHPVFLRLEAMINNFLHLRDTISFLYCPEASQTGFKRFPRLSLLSSWGNSCILNSWLFDIFLRYREIFRFLAEKIPTERKVSSSSVCFLQEC